MKKRYAAALVVLVLIVLIAAACAIASNPIISCKIDVPEEYIQAVSEEARGVYSNRLPLIPIRVTVESFSDGRIIYTIHYFPFGTVVKSYSRKDGYNIEKPLAPFS